VFIGWTENLLSQKPGVCERCCFVLADWNRDTINGAVDIKSLLSFSISDRADIKSVVVDLIKPVIFLISTAVYLK